MSWTNRMARHGSERSLHSLQSVQPSSTAAAANSNIIVRSNEPTRITSGSGASEPGTGQTPVLSLPGDSRIPRPSSTPLRRSASVRMRGERILSQNRPTAASSPLQHHYHHNHQHLGEHSNENYYRLGHYYNGYQQNHHRLQQHNHRPEDHFPVITENGTDSPRHRSLSLSLTASRPRQSNAATGTGADDSDAESVRSYGSACSTASACDHAHFALNGTTWSGRSRKYVVHCSTPNGDGDQYLTPTQRAARQVRKLQGLLRDARKEIEEKDREIFRLTKEVVELRLYKASLNSPDERTDSSDALTVREGNNPLSPETPCKDLPDEGSFETNASCSDKEPEEKLVSSDLPSSLADSGHFEDGSVHSKDSISLLPATNSGCSTVVVASSTFASSASEVVVRDEERRRIVDLYEKRIEEMHRRHVDELQTLKQKHNDKVESLLTQLSEVNTRYCEVRPSLDAAEVRVRELEGELETVKAELVEQRSVMADQEERNKQLYLKMYAKGQEAARLEQVDQIIEQARRAPPKVSVAELLQQLTVTQAELENIKDTSYSPEPHISADYSQSLLSAQEAVSLWVLGTRKAMYRRIVESRSSQGALDPEITLQFLKSAVYYFLTDKENHYGHLNAIESILGFTDVEKLNIDKIYRPARK